MNSLLMITACLFLIGTVWAKEGYLVNKSTGCKYECFWLGKNEFCDKECKAKNQGGSYGYCYSFACWCEGLPESTSTYPLPNKSCGRK
uniref:Neurotoxin Cex4 n=1 Tax=Centruroides exilicauda TaxID=6879 RepID=SCX4_CENEX|nr:RecName: Full=Neurotoxin Cex4; Flags: Precursor [Centruroides exilicauda]AAT97995.1 Cex4 neurotoxin precursor [Centruroides exilicauda]